MTRVLLFALAVLQVTLPAVAQEPEKATSAKAVTKALPANDVFSGTVTASATDSVTVVRKIPARPDEYRIFAIDKDTKIEGKLRLSARVTVRFKADDEGKVHALRIVVRADAKTSPGRPGTAR